MEGNGDVTNHDVWHLQDDLRAVERRLSRIEETLHQAGGGSGVTSTKPLTARQRDLLRRGLEALARETMMDRARPPSEAQLAALRVELGELAALL